MVWLVVPVVYLDIKYLRNYTGTRWLARWDKELDLFVKLCYYGLTTGTGMSNLPLFADLFIILQRPRRLAKSIQAYGSILQLLKPFLPRASFGQFSSYCL